MLASFPCWRSTYSIGFSVRPRWRGGWRHAFEQVRVSRRSIVNDAAAAGTITITSPYRTRAEPAAAEVEAIKNEKPLYNQQHHEAPVEPPIADAMAGKALLRRLTAAHRHGEVPGDGGGFHTRIDEALATLRLRRNSAGAAAAQEPQEGMTRGSLSGRPAALAKPSYTA
jgi:hypothetical protein